MNVTLRELRAELEELELQGLGDVSVAAWLRARKTVDRLSPGRIRRLATDLGARRLAAHSEEESLT